MDYNWCFPAVPGLRRIGGKAGLCGLFHSLNFSKMNWIDIKDREPILGQIVLSYSKEDGVIQTKYTTFQKGSIGYKQSRPEKWFEYITRQNFAMRHKATHWMPIINVPA